MNKLNINAIALAVTLAFSAGAMAEGMSKVDYKAGQDKISAMYKTDKAACGSLSGNASDICKAEAKGKEKVAAAELEAKEVDKAAATVGQKIEKAGDNIQDAAKGEKK